MPIELQAGLEPRSVNDIGADIERAAVAADDAPALEHDYPIARSQPCPEADLVKAIVHQRWAARRAEEFGCDLGFDSCSAAAERSVSICAFPDPSHMWQTPVSKMPDPAHRRQSWGSGELTSICVMDLCTYSLVTPPIKAQRFNRRSGIPFLLTRMRPKAGIRNAAFTEAQAV